jgi:hypothetical protein
MPKRCWAECANHNVVFLLSEIPYSTKIKDQLLVTSPFPGAQAIIPGESGAPVTTLNGNFVGMAIGAGTKIKSN